MNLRSAYQRWAEQNPGEARWFPWIWTGAILVACGMLWALFSQWRSGHFSPPAPPAVTAPPAPVLASGAFARQMIRRYPNCPEAWVEAAEKAGLPPPDGRALRLAARLRPSPHADRADFAGALHQTAARMAVGEPEAALVWLDQQPAAVRTAAALQARRADLAAAVRQLPELKDALQAGAWGPQDPDALDLAFASAAAFDGRHLELAADLWRAALDRTTRAAGPLAALERLATDLGMEAEAAVTFDTERAVLPGDSELLHRWVVWASGGSSAEWSRALAAWEEAAPDEAKADARPLRPQGARRQ